MRNKPDHDQKRLHRRGVLSLFGASSVLLLTHCADNEAVGLASGSGGTSGSGGAGGSGQAGEGAGGSSAQAGSGGSAGASEAGTSSGSGGSTGPGGSGSGTVTRAWATGGTAAMKSAASYPDPFTSGAATCSLTCTVTQGPCWAPTAPQRQDISEAQPGIPLRLALRVVEADGCTPVEGAEVEIWHCDIRGIYSAKDVENVGFCTGNDAAALAAYYFRGRQITGANGSLVFDTCYPGWYASRAIHIHFVVRRAAHAGESTTTGSTVISQFFFPEDLTTSIFSSVEGYKDRGQPDTTLASDTVIGSLGDKEPYILDYAQMSDGAMLAWKTIAISDTDACGATGGGMGAGGGGQGGPGGGGGPPGQGGGPPGQGGGPPGAAGQSG